MVLLVQPRSFSVVLLVLSVAAASVPGPGNALPADGLRVDLCGPHEAVVGLPMGFVGRLTVSDHSPGAIAPFQFRHSVYVEVDGAPGGWVPVRPDGWFQFALLFEAVGTKSVRASAAPGVGVGATEWVLEAIEGGPPSGLSVDIRCYLAYRDASYAELYVVVGGVMGADIVHEELAPVGGTVHIDAGQACWTSVAFCDQTIDHQSAGFSMLIAPNHWWETNERPWAAWAGPFHYWAGTPLVAGCAPTLWVDVEAYTTTPGGVYHANLSRLQRDVCETGPRF